MALFKKLSIVYLVGSLFAVSNAEAKKPLFEPITGFDLNRYLGKWYEVARLPVSFEKNLVNVTATYSLKSNGTVKVFNEGDNQKKNGKHSTAIGKAKFKGDSATGHLRVSFFGPFYADYIIVDLDKEYGYAMVASSYDYLWILSRTPKLDQQIVDGLVAKAKGLGFNTDRFYFTPQR